MTQDQATQLMQHLDSLTTALNLLVQVVPSLLVLVVAMLGVWFGKLAGGAVVR